MNKAAAWLLTALGLLAGVLGVDAVWVVAAIASNRPCSWMALLAALDVAFMLRLCNVRPGTVRVLLGVLATALAVALAQWLIVATQVGRTLGLQPIDSALRLGPSLARQLLMLSLSRADLAWLLSSLPVAALLCLRWRSRGEANAG